MWWISADNGGSSVTGADLEIFSYLVGGLPTISNYNAGSIVSIPATARGEAIEVSIRERNAIGESQSVDYREFGGFGRSFQPGHIEAAFPVYGTVNDTDQIQGIAFEFLPPELFGESAPTGNVRGQIKYPGDASFPTSFTDPFGSTVPSLNYYFGDSTVSPPVGSIVIDEDREVIRVNATSSSQENSINSILSASSSGQTSIAIEKNTDIYSTGDPSVVMFTMITPYSITLGPGANEFRFSVRPGSIAKGGVQSWTQSNPNTGARLTTLRRNFAMSYTPNTTVELTSSQLFSAIMLYYIPSTVRLIPPGVSSPPASGPLEFATAFSRGSVSINSPPLTAIGMSDGTIIVAPSLPIQDPQILGAKTNEMSTAYDIPGGPSRIGYAFDANNPVFIMRRADRPDRFALGYESYTVNGNTYNATAQITANSEDGDFLDFRDIGPVSVTIPDLPAPIAPTIAGRRYAGGSYFIHLASDISSNNGQQIRDFETRVKEQGGSWGVSQSSTLPHRNGTVTDNTKSYQYQMRAAYDYPIPPMTHFTSTQRYAGTNTSSALPSLHYIAVNSSTIRWRSTNVLQLEMMQWAINFGGVLRLSTDDENYIDVTLTKGGIITPMSNFEDTAPVSSLTTTGTVSVGSTITVRGILQDDNKSQKAWSQWSNTLTLARQSSAPGSPSVEGTRLFDGSISYSAVGAVNNGGLPITAYPTRYKKSTDSTWTVISPAPTSPSGTITGLDADAAYDVSMQATNAIDSSAWSDEVEIGTYAGTSPPKPPAPVFWPPTGGKGVAGAVGMPVGVNTNGLPITLIEIQRRVRNNESETWGGWGSDFRNLFAVYWDSPPEQLVQYRYSIRTDAGWSPRSDVAERDFR